MSNEERPYHGVGVDGWSSKTLSRRKPGEARKFLPFWEGGHATSAPAIRSSLDNIDDTHKFGTPF